jgi:hypothetical protein
MAGQPVPDTYVTALFPAGRDRRFSSEPNGHSTRTDRNGEFRLEFASSREMYLVAVPHDTRPGAGDRLGSAITFYPSALTSGDAKTIRPTTMGLMRAEIVLRPSPLWTISGRVSASGGALAQGGTLKLDHLDGLYTYESHTIDIRPDGTFQTQALPPGSYFLEYREVFSDIWPQAWKASRAKVRLVDGNVTGVEVAPTTMVRVTGRVIVSATDRSAMSPSQVRVAAWPVDPEDNPGPQVVGNVRPDWTFEFFMWPGTGRVRVDLINSFPPPLVVSAIRLKGVDVMNKDVTFVQGQDPGELEVELIRR